VAQLVKHLPDFGSGHDLGILGSSPESGSQLRGEAASPSPSAPACVPSLYISLSVKKKKKERKK